MSPSKNNAPGGLLLSSRTVHFIANVLPVRTKLKKEEARILEERIKAGEGKTPAEVIRKDIERGNREFRRKRARKSKGH